MNFCPRCLPDDPAFFAAEAICPRCGGGLLAWPGRFQPEDQPLAVGGFSRVFLAHDPGGARAVLKCPRGGAFAAELLRAEADVLARLPQEEGLPVLLERVEVAQGALVAVAMTPVHGRSLGLLLPRGVPPWALLRAVRGLVHLLRACAAVGVHHLDLKPSNILLDGEDDAPRVGLLDFGSASLGGVRGLTPLWAAPELRQARGRDVPLPEAADVWSIGLILYAGMSGRLPAEADPDAAPTPLPLPDLDRLPTSLHDLVRRCLAFEPAARPSLRELADALGEIPDPRPVSVPLRILDPIGWQATTWEVDGLSALALDGLFEECDCAEGDCAEGDCAEGDCAEGDSAEGFDAAHLVRMLSPWLAEPCVADPDTRWAPQRWPEGAGRTEVAWGRDLVCALTFDPDGALELLRHAPTGLCLPPEDEGEADAILASSAADWVTEHAIPTRPGRLLLFPGLLFHRWAHGARIPRILRFSLSLFELPPLKIFEPREDFQGW